ncbi:MAG TPA: hypothetical protein VN420_03115 [Candidatus Fimivivens sp.]|nr:hypothetical protein [Candidatus Fimivivens sp.]
MKQRRIIRGVDTKSAEQLRDAMRWVVSVLSWSVHMRQSDESKHFSCDVISIGPLFGSDVIVFLHISGILCEHEFKRLEISVHSAHAGGEFIHESERALSDGAELAIGRFIGMLKQGLECG